MQGWVTRAVHRALGELPEPRLPDPDSAARAAIVVVVGTLVMLAGQLHRFPAEPLPLGAWRLLVHGGVPLAWFAAWECRRAGAARWVALLAALAVTALVLARVAFPGALDDLPRQPALLLAATAAVLAVAGWSLHAAHVDLGAWGLGPGRARWWAPRVLAAVAVIIPAVIFVVWGSPALRGFYPTWKPARTDAGAFLLGHLGIALDFLGWEFLFRGLLLQAFLRRGDPLSAICLQAIPFCLLHYNKPVVELVSSLLGGLVSGWFCVTARTFLPLWILHTVLITAVGATALWLS